MAKIRITARRHTGRRGVHPAHEWFTVLSGTARQHLRKRVVLVEKGQSAQFSTMVPHAITTAADPVGIIVVLDPDGRRAHLDSAES